MIVQQLEKVALSSFLIIDSRGCGVLRVLWTLFVDRISKMLVGTLRDTESCSMYKRSTARL